MILSFAAALGISLVVFDVIFGFAGVDPSFPLFAFIFLVALGIDYNIFLMARVREETLRHGTRQGMLRGLAVTGGVITSAGIVLAGTFSVLALLPLVFLTEIGFVIAFGVLLDTFIVRSILVPALVLDIGAADLVAVAAGARATATALGPDGARRASRAWRSATAAPPTPERISRTVTYGWSECGSAVQAVLLVHRDEVPVRGARLVLELARARRSSASVPRARAGAARAPRGRRSALAA